jgi:hypothetical protein
VVYANIRPENRIYIFYEWSCRFCVCVCVCLCGVCVLCLFICLLLVEEMVSLLFALIVAFVALAASVNAFTYEVPVPDPQVENNVVFGGELVMQDGIEDVVVSDPHYPDIVPDSWDWRNFGFMTTDLNQHIPVYW